jgi:hypothetical protein
MNCSKWNVCDNNSAFRYWFRVLQKIFLMVNNVHCYREQRFISTWGLKCCSRWTEELVLCLVKTSNKGTNALNCFYRNSLYWHIFPPHVNKRRRKKCIFLFIIKGYQTMNSVMSIRGLLFHQSFNLKLSIKKTCFYFLVQYTRKCINFTHVSDKPIKLCVIYWKWKKNIRNQS